MKAINSIETLREAIQLLEVKQANTSQLLKEQLKVSVENFKPANLLKLTLNELVSAPDFKNDIINASLSLAAGYVTKKMVIGTTHNPLKKVAGTVLQMLITNFASKNATGIKSATMDFIHTIFSKKDTQ